MVHPALSQPMPGAIGRLFQPRRSQEPLPGHPAASTIKRVEKKQRKRHTVEGLKAIREKSPAWLQNAIGLALIIAQRRTDILGMRFEGQKICGSCERGHEQKIPARP